MQFSLVDLLNYVIGENYIIGHLVQGLTQKPQQIALDYYYWESVYELSNVMILHQVERESLKVTVVSCYYHFLITAN